MIVDDRHNVVFLHNPKCAGTSVRRQLAHLDTTAGAFSAPGEIEGTGKVYKTHLPLDILAKHFRATYEKVKNYQSFVLVRDPQARFKSALAQRFREFLGKEITETADEEVLDEAYRLMEKLKDMPQMYPMEYIHFLPQYRFIENNNKRVVDHIFPIEEMSDFYEAISDACGEELTPGVPQNQTLTFRRPGLRHVARRINGALRTSLPSQFYKPIQKFGHLALTRKPATEKSALDHPDVQSFVEDFYKKDFEIYKEARKAVAKQAALTQLP